jgi:hypothetical protein
LDVLELRLSIVFLGGLGPDLSACSRLSSLSWSLWPNLVLASDGLCGETLRRAGCCAGFFIEKATFGGVCAACLFARSFRSAMMLLGIDVEILVAPDLLVSGDGFGRTAPASL